ncbi:5,10-methylenetetrahydrofolate reductase [hydrothermal vent metagenome]|uniref:methylenetetrahydrofolate reductase (NADH) n=1 Tax=hydrothermal vent metagenome TaxID=652676 RepID=A0A3B0YYY1_9ZZZZ
MQTQKQYSPTFSFEFFPPKTEKGAENLKHTRDELGKLGPEYFSVTFGAGGSTQQGTIETVLDIKQNGFNATPHLSCIGSTADNIRELLELYQNNGINRIVALRGDIPAGSEKAGKFQYANELVEFIRQVSGDYFHIEVAAYPESHPQSKSPVTDLQHFKLKVEAGANSAITQYFYNIDAYLYFVDDCEKLGLDLPITPGIMPITNYVQLARFSGMCGAEIPAWIRKRLQGFGDDKESIIAFGADVVTDLCQKLLDAGAPGLHFYTMNQIKASRTLWNNLNLS